MSFKDGYKHNCTFKKINYKCTHLLFILTIQMLTIRRYRVRCQRGIRSAVVIMLLFGAWGVVVLELNISNSLPYTDQHGMKNVGKVLHTHEKENYDGKLVQVKPELNVSASQLGQLEAGKLQESRGSREIKVGGPVKRKGGTGRWTNKTDEQQFYTLKTAKVNIIEDQFVIKSAEICKVDGGAPFLLIVVPSVPSHFNVRHVIRNTYGSYKMNRGTLKEKTDYQLSETVKLIFVVGNDGNNKTDLKLQSESGKHGDIVQADFRDSYNNLTRKMLIALKWTTDYCDGTRYLLKADEDVFVNVPVLIKLLKDHPFGAKGVVYGHLYNRSKVIRKGRWAVGFREFPLPSYPPYVSGTSYVISVNIIRQLLHVSEYFHYIPVEDAFITGILARVVESNHMHVQGFSSWTDKKPDSCAFVKTGTLSATKVDGYVMNKLWTVTNDYKSQCPLS